MEHFMKCLIIDVVSSAIAEELGKYKFVGRELRGKTLGILGFGRIGQRVGELARAFRMEVVAYDPYLPAEVFEQQHAKSMSIDEVLKVSDFVTSAFCLI